jgi:formylglycine-generating enzyme required for sulfatase activity
MFYKNEKKGIKMNKKKSNINQIFLSVIFLTTSFHCQAWDMYNHYNVPEETPLETQNTLPGVSYTGSPYTFTLNTVITTITPTITGSVSACSSAPAVPSGLFIDPITCAISGTPIAVQASTAYSITAANVYGSTTVNIDITVNTAAPSNLAYTGSPYTFSQDTVIATITPTVTGTVTTCLASPTLPTGLAINNTTCAISGTPTTTQTATAYTITATNAYGNGTANINITVIVPPAGTQYALSAGGVAFKMVYVPGGLTTPTGAADTTTATVANAYTIAETEVTYQFWNAVYTWAIANGYTFANVGHQGSDSGCPVSVAPVGTNQHPVTCINWRDAIVWTNALTEYYNLQNATSYAVVYTSDAAFTTPIRSSLDGSYDGITLTTNMTAGSFDTPYINPNAKGFRLPTDAEWELAARYIADSNSDGDIMDIGEYYPGGHISGDTTADYLTSVILGNYGWYSVNSGSSTNVVATKTANALGLYDMSGNVDELVFDWYPGQVGTFRVPRGGHWGGAASTLQVSFMNAIYPYIETIVTSFRIVRTP